VDLQSKLKAKVLGEWRMCKRLPANWLYEHNVEPLPQTRRRVPLTPEKRPVLNQSHGINGASTLVLDVPGKVRHVNERELDFTDRPAFPHP
jgi:hypothetical protein